MTSQTVKSYHVHKQTNKQTNTTKNMRPRYAIAAWVVSIVDA